MQMGETIKDTENDPLENNLGISWNLGPCHLDIRHSTVCARRKVTLGFY